MTDDRGVHQQVAEAALDIAMIDEFAARCAAGPPGVVADLGCGTGRVTAYLARSGLESAVLVARRRHPNLDFAVAATQALPVDDAAFAGLPVWYSLIHTPPEELGDPIGELARVLQPGGHLLIGFQAGHGERVDRNSSFGHHVAFTNFRHDPDHVAGLLAREGFNLTARLLRSATGKESTRQAFLLAIRRP